MPSSPEPGGQLEYTSFVEAVMARRMTRSFRDAPVARERVETLLRTALTGPSAGNTQSLEFVVLDGENVALYWETTLPIERRNEFRWPGLLRAPVLVIPYVEPARYVARYSEPDKASTGLGDDAAWPVPYWWVDGGAAVQTLLLAVAADHLGACFFGQFDNEAALRERYGVSPSMRALGTVAIGYPDSHDRPSVSARRGRRPASETIHWNHWSRGPSGTRETDVV